MGVERFQDPSSLFVAHTSRLILPSKSGLKHLVIGAIVINITGFDWE
jgi:hypothetical protein